MEIKNIQHACNLGGTVTVVEVSEPEIVLFIESKLAFEGMSVVYNPECTGCELGDACMPVGLKKGDKIQIMEVLKEAPCKRKKMNQVAVKRL